MQNVSQVSFSLAGCVKLTTKISYQLLIINTTNNSWGIVMTLEKRLYDGLKIFPVKLADVHFTWLQTCYNEL